MLKLRLAILNLFLVHGLVVATWASRLPSIQDKLGLSAASLGLILLASAVGALLAMPVAGRLMHAFGSRGLGLYSSLAFCLSLPLLALSPNSACLALALFYYGFTAGAMDIAMNAQAIHLEKQARKSVMSMFHAFFSMGGLLGSAGGGLLASLGWSPFFHFALTALVYCLLVLATAPFLVSEEPSTRETHAVFSPFSWPLAALCMLGFCCFLSEGALIDWGGIYLYRVLHAPESVAALGYAFFSVAMTGSRLIGDAVTNRLGAGRVVLACCLLAAAGLAGILLSSAVAYALFGFLVVGIGFSVIIPLTFGMSGRIGGNSRSNLATVTVFSYSAFLIGPTVIGLVAEKHGLRMALALLIGLMAIGTVASRIAFKKRSLHNGEQVDRGI